MSLIQFKLLSVFLIFGITALAAYFPFKLKYHDRRDYDFPIGNALAAGIFLGAALIHMLAESAEELFEIGVKYPVAFFFAGVTFLMLLLLEHIGMEMQHRNNHSKEFIPILAVIMLAIHSLFEGIALGSTENLHTGFVIFFAIISHKWAASFALAVELNRSKMSMPQTMGFFMIFALAVPLGVALGGSLSFLANSIYTVAILNAMAAGTFLYIGTLHGLQSSVLVEKCCDLNTFAWVIVGFLMMAVLPLVFNHSH